jgi:DNA-binding MarR family transcriptional regulator
MTTIVDSNNKRVHQLRRPMNFIMDKSLGFIINRASVAVKKEFVKRLRSYDLTPEQWSILNRLGEQDGLTQKNLAERTYKDQPNTARILDKLEKKELLKRADNPEDRRAFLIFLTDKGKDLRESIIPITTQLNKDAASGLKKEEYEQLISLLGRVYENLN